jgi:hypothetical protein
MLLGQGDSTGLQNQLNYPLLTYEQLAITATRAWRELSTQGDKTQEITKILQGPEEPFQDLVACLLQHMSRTAGDPELDTLLVKQLAFENANKHCKEALKPYSKSLLYKT